MRLGKREENRFPKIKNIVPLAGLDDLVFGGWDIFEENAYEAAKNAEVLTPADIDRVKDELSDIKPMKACFDQNFVKRLHGTWVKEDATKWDQMMAVREDIRNFKAANKCDRVVVIWCASTEIFCH